MSARNVEINKNSRFCELHFKPEDIIKEDAFVQTDGTVIYVPRQRRKLKEGAVPSIFPLKRIPYFNQIEHEKFSTECNLSETVLHSVEEPDPNKFSVENINIAKAIEVPTSYWFLNIDDNRMMWTCWAHDLSYILRRVIVSPNMEINVNIIK